MFNMKSLRIAYNVLLGCITVVALLLIVSMLPIPGNIKFLSVLSGSMEPTIHTGAVVMVKSVSSYAVGDIITFTMDGAKTPVTHRVVKVTETDSQRTYVTKGDANNGPDVQDVAEADVIGKVLIDVPYAGYVVAFVRKPMGFFLLILIPVIAIIYSEVGKIWRELMRIRNKRKTEKNKSNVEKEN